MSFYKRMLLNSAAHRFVYKGVDCWVVKNDVMRGMDGYENTHNGYFHIVLPGIGDYDQLNTAFRHFNGEDALPNGSFTLMQNASAPYEYVVGFDGVHEHNRDNPVTKDDAIRQIKAAIDFIIDTKLGSPARTAAQA